MEPPSDSDIERHAMDVSLSLFTDRVAKNYFNSLPFRYIREKDLDKKAQMVAQASSIIGMLIVLVYNVYPASKEFKEAISADSELYGNFTMIRGWLDAHDGKEKASRILGKLEGGSLTSALEKAAAGIETGAG